MGLEEGRAQEMTRNLQNKKLYVSGFPKTNQVTEDMIKTYFSRFGPVDRVLMAMDPKTNSFRGFCYVIMINDSDYDMLVQSQDSFSFFGHSLSVSSAKTSSEIFSQRKQGLVNSQEHKSHFEEPQNLRNHKNSQAKICNMEVSKFSTDLASKLNRGCSDDSWEIVGKCRLPRPSIFQNME